MGLRKDPTLRVNDEIILHFKRNSKRTKVYVTMELVSKTNFYPVKVTAVAEKSELDRFDMVFGMHTALKRLLEEHRGLIGRDDRTLIHKRFEETFGFGRCVEKKDVPKYVIFSGGDPGYSLSGATFVNTGSCGPNLTLATSGHFNPNGKING